MKRLFRATSLITISHNELVEANTPEEAESIYEDDIVPELDKMLGEFNAVVEDVSTIMAEAVDEIDGEVISNGDV